MNNKLIPIVLTLVVGIILAGSVLMPVLNDATKTEETFANEGLWRMKEIENGDVWTRTSTEGWTYGDSHIASGGSNVILGDDWCIRAIGHIRSDSTVNASSNLSGATVTAGEELIVASKTDTTWTRNLDYPGYGIAPNGAYTLTDFNTSSYLNGDSAIYGSGVSEIGSIQVFVHVEASVDDGATFTVSQSAGGYAISDVTITNEKVNYSEVSGYKDLYKVESVTCDISLTATIESVETPITGTITFSSYVVPYEVTAELSNHLTPGQIALVGAIPILVIVALLVVAVGVVARKND